jgi:hypothetical protein
VDIKGLRGVEVKDEAKGEVSAVFATFDVIDSDKDVTLPGAFEDGAPVRLSAYQHGSWSGALPVGKGVIRTSKTDAIFDGQFFMNTTAGRDTFEVVKQMGDMQEWSYGYDALEYSFGEKDDQHVRFLAKQLVHEVSPVLIGAGVGTRTLTAKSGGRTFSDEATLVVASVNALVDRAADVMAKRAEKGKGLGADSAALLDQLQAQMKRLGELLADPEPDLSAADVEREFVRFLSANRIATQGASS